MNNISLLAGSEANKAIVIDIDTQRVKARHVNIESEVELASVDEEWSRNVLLNYDWSLLWHIFPFVDHTYANAPGRRRLTHRQTYL